MIQHWERISVLLALKHSGVLAYENTIKFRDNFYRGKKCRGDLPALNCIALPLSLLIFPLDAENAEAIAENICEHIARIIEGEDEEVG